MIKEIKEQIVELNLMKKYPSELFYKGNLELLKRKKVSIVGTRNPNIYAQEATSQLAKKLSLEGVCIVSGGALGVDAIAHKGASESNTILVSPCGLDLIYPAVNAELIRNVAKQGLLLSQFKNDFKSTPWSFVARNEIVVALGEVLIVTQADLKSGSLRSVEFAKKMGKEIFVLPHRLNESLGTNDLLKNGMAKAIYDIDDFVSRFQDEKKTQKEETDEFLEFCQTNPFYDEAISKYSNKVYEYELAGKIEIKNGRISVVLA